MLESDCGYLEVGLALNVHLAQLLDKGNYKAFRMTQINLVSSRLFMADMRCEPCIISCKAFRNVRLRRGR